VTEPIWFTEEMALAIHARLAEEHGSPAGIRDRDLLASAIARPQQLATDGQPSVSALTASLAFGIARNHPFVDGNKRVALMAAYVFLGLNGWSLIAPEAEAVAMTIDLAAGTADEAAFSRWLEANVEAR
jgi:death-on-curing protein